jgi:hypothetical protein
MKTLNLLYYLFDEETKKGRYYEIINKLVKRMNRVGIPPSKKSYQMVLDFLHKKTLERAVNVIEVIKVY